jgi:hypothetical protein
MVQSLFVTISIQKQITLISQIFLNGKQESITAYNFVPTKRRTVNGVQFWIATMLGYLNCQIILAHYIVWRSRRNLENPGPFCHDNNMLKL